MEHCGTWVEREKAKNDLSNATERFDTIRHTHAAILSQAHERRF